MKFAFRLIVFASALLLSILAQGNLDKISSLLRLRQNDGPLSQHRQNSRNRREETRQADLSSEDSAAADRRESSHRQSESIWSSALRQAGLDSFIEQVEEEVEKLEETKETKKTKKKDEKQASTENGQTGGSDNKNGSNGDNMMRI